MKTRTRTNVGDGGAHAVVRCRLGADSSSLLGNLGMLQKYLSDQVRSNSDQRSTCASVDSPKIQLLK